MKKLSGFTFIEIIIAIFVFSVGILAVLQVMTRNLSIVAQSQTKTTAAMFAQESLALTFSLRDANRDKWFARDCIPAQDVFVTVQPAEEDFCQYRMQDIANSGQYLLIGFSPTAYMDIAVGWDSLLQATTGDMYYVSYSWTQQAYYRRYVAFQPVTENAQTLPTDNILKVTSVVEYIQWAETGQVQLESFIWAR